MTVYDLNKQRLGALQRVQQSISEMKQVLATSADASAKVLAANLLKQLKIREAQLSAGMPKEMRK